MNSVSKAAAELLVDLQSVYDPDADLEAMQNAFTLVLDRLGALGAIEATLVGSDELRLEVTPLLVAIATNQMFLIDRLAKARGESVEAVRFELRQFVAHLDDD